MKEDVSNFEGCTEWELKITSGSVDKMTSQGRFSETAMQHCQSQVGKYLFSEILILQCVSLLMEKR